MIGISREEKLALLVARVRAQTKVVPSRTETSVPGMLYSCQISKEKVINCFYEPCVVCVLQGCKQSIVGAKEFNYGPGRPWS